MSEPVHLKIQRHCIVIEKTVKVGRTELTSSEVEQGLRDFADRIAADPTVLDPDLPRPSNLFAKDAPAAVFATIPVRRRNAVISIDHTLWGDEHFGPHLIAALRELADLLEGPSEGHEELSSGKSLTCGPIASVLYGVHTLEQGF